MNNPATARQTFPEYRLHPSVEAYILEQCEMVHRRHARIHLDFGHADGVQGFVDALEGRMEVHADVLDTDPQEICVKATGTDTHGSGWRGMNIVLLAPHWATDAESSHHLAEVIVDHWERLCAVHAAAKVSAS